MLNILLFSNSSSLRTHVSYFQYSSIMFFRSSLLSKEIRGLFEMLEWIKAPDRVSGFRNLLLHTQVYCLGFALAIIPAPGIMALTGNLQNKTQVWIQSHVCGCYPWHPWTAAISLLQTGISFEIWPRIKISREG